MYFRKADVGVRIRLKIATALVAFLLSVDCQSQAQDSAVALMYNRVGSKDGATTATAALESHLAHLSANNYEVLPLPQIIASLKLGAAIPQRALALTFDGGHISVFREAWPRLKALGFTFTVFIATDFIDAGSPDYMSWDQLRELASSGVTIGTLGATYDHLVLLKNTDAAADIQRANQRFMDEIGSIPELFAYPFGEYSAALQAIVARHGHSAAFGHHSGVIYGGADYLALPRFPLVGGYSDMARFRTVVDTLPLPVADLVPVDPFLTNNPPALGFTIIGEIGPLDTLACYLPQFGRLNLERLGPSRIEVRFPEPLSVGRSRINCTLPGPEGRWRWFGLQLLVR